MNENDETMSEKSYGKRKEPTNLDNIYRDGMQTNPDAMKAFLLVMYVILMVLCSYLVWFTVNFLRDSIVEDIPGLQALLLATILMCITTMVIFSIYVWVTFSGGIKYDIEGEIQLDIKYDPLDAFRYNPWGSIGSLVTTAGVVVFIVAIAVSSGIPAGDSVLVLFFAVVLLSPSWESS